MDIDLTRTIGLGLTTAIVGTYTIYQRAVRHNKTALKKKDSKEEGEDESSLNNLENSSDDNPTEDYAQDESLPEPPANMEELQATEFDDDIPSVQPPAPPSPLVICTSSSSNSSMPASIFALTSELENDDAETPHDNNDEDDNETTGSVDFTLYRSLQDENDELRRKLVEITHSQERDMNLLMPSTPNGTRWSPHALLEEVTRLRMDLSLSKQAQNATQDQLFTVQQHLHEEQKKMQFLYNMLMMERDDLKNTTLEDLVAVVKEWKEYAFRVKDWEQKCTDLEAAAIDSTAKILDLREQLNAVRLSKVQEVTELRKQLVTAEETFQHREAELLLCIQTLESRLIDSSMKLNSSPVREELAYRHACSPVTGHNANFEDLTHTVTSAAHTPVASATGTPNRLRPNSTSSKKSTTPNRIRHTFPETSNFTATAPVPLILSSTLSAVLNNNISSGSSSSSLFPESVTSKRPSTPTSASRPRSGSASKTKPNVVSMTSPSMRGSNRLTNYTNSSGNKNVSTQEFLRMLNDPSGSNGGL